MATPVDDPSQPLEYAHPGLVAKRSRVRIIVGAVIAVLVGFVLITEILIPIGPGSHHQAPRVQCASNMRQIGQGIAMYANAHGGVFPDDLKPIFEDEDLTPSVFACPSSNETPAPIAPTTQATAAGLLQPGHVSYVYVGKGVSNQTATDDTVVLYEPLSNHASNGMNVMFGDFHVEWLTAAEAATILKQVAAKRFPVRYPLTQPAKDSLGS